MFNVKIAIILGLLGLVTFCGWLFWWPLIELTYGYITLDTLIVDQFKTCGLIIGGIIFWVSLYLLIKKGVRLII